MNFPTAPAYSIKGSGRKGTIGLEGSGIQSPGPQYNTFGMGNQTRSFQHVIGTAKRSQINQPTEKTPGPNYYQPSAPQKTIQNTIPKGEIKQPNNMIPDPTFYRPNTNYTKERIRHFDMGTRYPGFAQTDNKNPGPTNYQMTASTFRNSRKSKFGSAKRFSEIKPPSPGPGQYQLTSQRASLKSAVKFPKSQRAMNKAEQTPAPNQYVKSSFVEEDIKSGRGKTLSARFVDRNKNQQLTKVAYGNYEANSPNQQFHRCFSLGKIGIDARLRSSREVKPGVGRYNVSDFQHKNSARPFLNTGYGYARSSNKDNPGPGRYNIAGNDDHKCSVTRSKSALIFHEHTSIGRYPTSNIVPGVGRYRVSKGLETERGWTIGQSPRTDFVSKNATGVGDYNILQKDTGAVTIPKARRNPETEKSPGPGDYYLQSTIGNTNLYSKYVS